MTLRSVPSLHLPWTSFERAKKHAGPPAGNEETEWYKHVESPQLARIRRVIFVVFLLRFILFAFEVQIDGLWLRVSEVAMVMPTSVFFRATLEHTWTYCIAQTWQCLTLFGLKADLMAVLQVGCLAQINVNVASLRGWSGKVKYGCLIDVLILSYIYLYYICI